MRAKRTGLVHIIYVSRLAPAAGTAEGGDRIAEIGRVAQRKNEFSVITSFLILECDFACQVIEGERASVQETFDRIGADPRHREVRICDWREIPRREFVHSFKGAARGGATEPLFAAADLLPMLRRGTPKASAVHGLALALQADAMARRGIDHLFV